MVKGMVQRKTKPRVMPTILAREEKIKTGAFLRFLVPGRGLEPRTN